MESDKCGENLTWTLDDGTLTISGTGKMDNYSLYDEKAPWYSSRELIRKVIIEEGVTTIGKYALYFCESLTSVIIPNSVTTIGWSAFSGCTGFTSIEIPASVTTIGESAFSSCWSLTSVIIHNSVTTIGESAFSGCSSLESVKIPGSVTTIDWAAFNDCTSLKEIHYPAGRGFEKNLSKGNPANLISHNELPPAQKKSVSETDKPAETEENVEQLAEMNRTVYRNKKIREITELAAMEIVMTIERESKFSPKDVSSQNLGYDIKSTSSDGNLRLIKVKCVQIDAETVTVSRNEIDAAFNNPDNFILAIVKLCGDNNETIYIRKPFKQQLDKAALSVNFSIKELIKA